MKKKFIVLGVNYNGGHDTSAALMIDGELKCAYEEERFILEKHTNKFPEKSITACLKYCKIKKKNIDLVCLGFNQKKYIKEKYFKMALEDDKYIQVVINDINYIRKSLSIEENIKKYFPKSKIITFDHYDCHHASVYFPSGLKKSLLVSYDGKAEVNCSSIKLAKGNKFINLNLFDKYPNSLGYLYSAVTHYLGWKFFCDEGIVMGLAAFGNPNAKIKGKKIINIFRNILKVKNNKILINEKWISYHLIRDKWISDKFINFFGAPRKSNDHINQNYKNIAAALQKRIEEVVIKILKNLKKKYKIENLCFSGGLALNCTLNGKIMKMKIFKELFVHPGSGDQGQAIGACYLGHLTKYPNFKFKKMDNYYLGSGYNKLEIRNTITKFKNKIKVIKTHNIYKSAAELLKKGKIGSIFNGRSEFGPRALGNRSIICKPYPYEMKSFLNKKVKFRENFRPFAPAILEKFQNQYFELRHKSLHMLYAIKAKKNILKKIPATIHVDNTSRVQTVTQKSNLNLYNLLKEFYNLTNIPVLLNTSFNIKGQPIVDNPNAAIETFLSTKIDFIILDNYLIEKFK